MAIRTTFRFRVQALLLLILAAVLVAVPAAQARSSHVSSAVGGTVTTQGTRWLLNGVPFIPIVAYGPVDPNVARVVPETCITSDEVPSLVAAETQVVLIDQPAQKDGGCGKTQAAQVSAMDANLAGSGLGWNYGPTSPILKAATGGVVPFPATKWVDFQGPGVQDIPQPGIVSLLDVALGSCILPRGFHSLGLNLTPDLAKAMAVGPTLVRIHLSKLGNCLSPKQLEAEFWSSIAEGAGISWSLDDYNPGHTFDPSSTLVTEAGRLVGQLATVQDAVLFGKPLKLKLKNTAIPVWSNNFSGGWAVEFEKIKPHVRFLWGWKYDGQIFVLAVGQGTYGGRIATRWKTHINGKWKSHSWHWPKIPLKLKGLKHYKAHGLFGSKGLKRKGSTASIKMGALGAKWFVFTPKK